MSSLPPASREEVSALLGEVDSSYVDRVLDTGASLDEIGEALNDLEGHAGGTSRIPSSARVASARQVLAELFALRSDRGSSPWSMR
jgi:hypothetical protein